jgi:hypothetical protein
MNPAERIAAAMDVFDHAIEIIEYLANTTGAADPCDRDSGGFCMTHNYQADPCPPRLAWEFLNPIQ